MTLTLACPLFCKAIKKAEGGHIGGTRPFGYDVDGVGKDAVLVPRAGEYEWIPRIVEASKTQSLRKVSACLDEQGVELSHVGVNTVLKRGGASAE